MSSENQKEQRGRHRRVITHAKSLDDLKEEIEKANSDRRTDALMKHKLRMKFSRSQSSNAVFGRSPRSSRLDVSDNRYSFLSQATELQRESQKHQKRLSNVYQKISEALQFAGRSR